MSYSQYFVRKLMDMGSLLGNILGTILNYNTGSYVHLNGPSVKIPSKAVSALHVHDFAHQGPVNVATIREPQP